MVSTVAAVVLYTGCSGVRILKIVFYKTVTEVGGGGDFTVTHWIVWGRNREKKRSSFIALNTL